MACDSQPIAFLDNSIVKGAVIERRGPVPAPHDRASSTAQ
jgi:hypothetical protein